MVFPHHWIDILGELIIEGHRVSWIWIWDLDLGLDLGLTIMCHPVEC